MSKKSPLELKRDSVKKSFGDFNSLQDRAHNALYEMLAGLVGFTRLTLEKDNYLSWKHMCDMKEVKIDGDGNKWLPVVKVVLGDVDGKASAAVYKYAKVIRYCIDNDIAEADVVEHIQKLTYKKDANSKEKVKLTAVYAYDSDANPTSRGGANGVDPITTVKGTYATEHLGHVDIEGEEFAKLSGLCVLLGQVSDDGIEVKTVFKGEEEMLRRLIAAFKPKETTQPSTPSAASPWSAVSEALETHLEEAA